MLVILILMMFDPGVSSSYLTEITGKTFGNYSGIIPAAFGDFNGDKLTDIVVLKSNPQDNIITVRILLANEVKVVTTASSQDPLFNWGTDEQHVHCNFPKVTTNLSKIINYVPLSIYFEKIVFPQPLGISKIISRWRVK